MGAGSSSLLLNKRELQVAEREPLLLMDRILNFILTGIRDKDVFKLQDPATCQKYLLVSVEQLKTLFTEIQLYPVRDQAGKILFRRIEDITRPTETGAREQLAENCLAIGYFYVRILQLYLALALTILDDPMIAGIAGQAPIAPGFQRGGGSEFTFDAMTRLPDETLAFVDLGRQRSGGLYSIPRRDTSDPMSVRLIPRSQTEGLIYGLTTSKFDPRGTQKEMRAKYYVKFIEGSGNRYNKIKIIQARIPRDQRDGSSTAERDINIDVPITDDYKLLIPYGQPYHGRAVREITPFLRKLLAEFEQGNIRFLTTTYAQKIAEYRGEQTYPEYEADIRRPAEPAWGRPAAAAGELRAVSTQKALDFSSALQSVQRTRPLAHCIARSYQLINIDTMAGAKEARTNICNRSFMTRAQIPDGRSITSIDGIKAFSLLYSVLDKTKIGLTNHSSSTLKVALGMLTGAFRDGRQATSIDQITARVPPRCGSRSGPGKLVGVQDIGRAKIGVQALWAYQRKHVAAVAGMFKEIFNVSRDGAVIGFNPRILAGGIPYVEQLVFKAQEILAKYYTNCEAIYQETVEDISSVQLDATGAGAGAR